MPVIRRLSMALALAAALAPITTSSQGAPKIAPSLFAGLRFRNIGPAAMAGRIDDFAVLESNPAVFYVAAATGGLWKTTNNGTTWEVLFNDQDDVVSIGDVAIAPNDANVVWVGTGENNNRQSSSWGTGVYKSTDGGHTWKMSGLADTRHVGRIVVDPVDHDVVYVAALGHLFGPNRERGVYKTTDGGTTWTNVLFVDEDTGATDLAMDPQDNKVLYAATYQRRRSSWGFDGGGPGSAIYKSTDAGRTWSKLTNGLPAGPLGRIGLDIFRANPDIVYARVEHRTESGIYRTDDAGNTWRKVSSVNPRPMYFSQIRVDPADANRLYVLGTWLEISDDGGRTFHEVTQLHPDHHALWIDPRNPRHVMTGHDGGVGISYDRGEHWDWLDNMDLGQFYHVGYDMDTPYGVYGGLQDNDAFGGPSATRRRHGIGNDEWYNVASGDGFEAFADPRNSRIVYAESQGGNVNRVDRPTAERKAIKPQAAPGEPPLRWNWDTPMMLSPHSPDALLMGANRLFRSTDAGHSWTAISPDLTAHIDRETLSLMGVSAKDITLAKNDGVSAYGTITTFSESPKKAGLFYAGADDGTVSMSRDDGRTWTNVSGRVPGVPKNTYVSRVAASAFEEGTAYLTFDGHREDDYTPYVFTTSDYGQTWRSIASDLPKGQVVRCITEDPKNGSVLYLGTEFGLFVSLDRGAHWTRIRSGLPTVPVAEITIHPRDNDMLVATHGRSIWILDDLAPVQHAAEALARDAELFPIRPAMSFWDEPEDRSRWMGDRPFWGHNPPRGAPISYYLKQDAKDVRLKIADASGTAVAEVSGIETEHGRAAGINRVYWDLRHEALPLPKIPGQEVRGPTTYFADPLQGPYVLPGEYKVTLVVDGRDAGTSSIQVSNDRAIQLSDADRKAWHDTALALHQLEGAADRAAETVVVIGDQLAALQRIASRTPAALDAVKSELDTTRKTLADLRARLGVPSPDGGGRGGSGGGGGANRNVRGRITNVKTQIMASTSAPTAFQTDEARLVRGDLAKAIDDVNKVISTDMPALMKTLASGGALPVVLPAIKD
ncbi:MAG TPA: hypothetical protein VL309_04920 [Vicinamibacterales bacterium]|nr:hypothetical protein [Vicinamibacterales bacterium]